MQESPAKLGTSLAFGFCYVLSLCFQVAPCFSDQVADLGQHVWGLDMYMAGDAGKLSLKIFDPATRLLLNLLVGLGTKWLHFTWR